MIFRIMVAFFALSLVGSFFVGYSSDATLLASYPNTTAAINNTFYDFNAAANGIGTGTNIIDILGFMAWSAYGAVKAVVGIPSMIWTFSDETIAMIGVAPPFLTTLVNFMITCGMIYFLLFLIEIVRPNSTGVKAI